MSYLIPIEVIPIEDDGFHIMMEAEINGKMARLLIDTGASRTVFDESRIPDFLPEGSLFEKVEKLSTGLGTSTMESKTVNIDVLSFGKLRLKNYTAVVLNMEHVNRSFEMIGIPPIDGVLGGDILFRHKAIIDYNEKTISLERPTSRRKKGPAGDRIPE